MTSTDGTFGRVSIDLDRLLRDRVIDAETARTLKANAEQPRGKTLLIQLLSIFGALAIATGVIIIAPAPLTGLALALVALAIATLAKYSRWVGMEVFAHAMAISGTFGVCGWLGLQFEDSGNGLLINAIATALVLASALFFASRFLIAFVPLGLGAMIGSGTAYWHAAYAIFVREPLMTVVIFAVMALVLFSVADRGATIRHAQASIAARVSWFMMHFGFWVGSLWGDHPGQHLRQVFSGEEWTWEQREAFEQTAFFIPELAFTLGWAAVALATLFALKNNRFAVNSSIVFLAINAFTQYFEYFEDNPFALVFGGIALVGLAFALVRLDQSRMMREERP